MHADNTATAEQNPVFVALEENAVIAWLERNREMMKTMKLMRTNEEINGDGFHVEWNRVGGVVEIEWSINSQYKRTGQHQLVCYEDHGSPKHVVELGGAGGGTLVIGTDDDGKRVRIPMNEAGVFIKKKTSRLPVNDTKAALAPRMDEKGDTRSNTTTVEEM